MGYETATSRLICLEVGGWRTNPVLVNILLVICNLDHQLSQNFHRFVFECMFGYTKWENKSLTIKGMSSAFKTQHNNNLDNNIWWSYHCSLSILWIRSISEPLTLDFNLLFFLILGESSVSLDLSPSLDFCVSFLSCLVSWFFCLVTFFLAFHCCSAAWR